MADTRKGDGLAKLTQSGDFEMWQFRMRLYLQALGVYSIADSRKIAPTDPVAITESNGKEPEGSATSELAKIDRQTIREWREYQSCKDIAVVTIMQGLSDEIVRKYCGDEYLRNPVAVWKLL